MREAEWGVFEVCEHMVRTRTGSGSTWGFSSCVFASNQLHHELQMIRKIRNNVTKKKKQKKDEHATLESQYTLAAHPGHREWPTWTSSLIAHRVGPHHP